MVDDFVWMLLHENSIHFNYFVFSCIWTLHYMKFLNFVCFLVEFGISGFTFLSSCICWICWSLILILLDLGQLEFLSVIICCFYLFSIDWKDMVILGSLWGIKEKEGVPFFFFFFFRNVDLHYNKSFNTNERSTHTVFCRSFSP